MNNDLEQTQRGPENSDQPEYKIFYSNVDENPIDKYNVIYHLLKLHFNYHIEFKEGATDIYKKKIPNHLQVMMDSQETRGKINSIFDKLYPNDIFCLLNVTTEDDTRNIIKLLQGNPENYLKTRKDIKEVTKIDKPDFLRVIERCFMSSYETRKRHAEGRTNPQTLEYEKIYNRLEEKGVKPLDPESMGGLLAPVIEKILDEQPNLRPNLLTNSDFDDSKS